MAQSGKGKLNFRCPACFMREIDIDMFFDEEKKEYYCLRCCYTADEKTVLAANQTARFRYKDMLVRHIFFEDEMEEAQGKATGGKVEDSTTLGA